MLYTWMSIYKKCTIYSIQILHNNDNSDNNNSNNNNSDSNDSNNNDSNSKNDNTSKNDNGNNNSLNFLIIRYNGYTNVILSTDNLLTFDATAQLIHALITIRLDFCNNILYNLPNNKIERLHRIQNQATHMLKRIPRRNHITPVLRDLHWLKSNDRIIFKLLLLAHKAVNNTAPEYLCDLIRLNVKSTIIRTRVSFDPCLLCVPPISKTCANSLFNRSFVYAAPTVWNALDLDMIIAL